MSRTPPPGLLTDGAKEAPDGGGNYKQSQRFRKLSPLLKRYNEAVLKRGNNLSWINIVRQYDRLPYKGRDGTIMPNFGTLRFKVDRAITTYTDFATERQMWANITTDHGDTQSSNLTWGRHISAAYQKYCNDRWDQSFAEIMLACKDMIMFSKGAFVWLDPNSCYPENVSIENVWPDGNAGMFPKSFDTCFVRRRLTAVELYDKVEDESEDGDSEWDRAAVLRLLTSNAAQTQYKEGMSKEDWHVDGRDFVFDIVFAYVKEYKCSDEGNDYSEKKISQYVFPASGMIPVPNRSGMTAQKAQDRQGFLYYKNNSFECMDQCISIVAHTVFRKFYEDPSFAQLIYTLSKTYDMVMNRILQAVEDNMRVYLKSTSQDQMQKMQRMRHGNWQALEPGVDLVQEKIQRPVKEAAGVLRTIMVDQESGIGQYQQGGQDTDNASQRKTAHQSIIDHTESLRIDSSQLKIFNCYMSAQEQEKFRRFTHPTDSAKASGSREYKLYQKFVAYLESRHVPKAAWDMDNVTVNSVLNLGAGSPSERERAASTVLQALAVPASSEGERKAQYDLVAAAVGVNNADAYLPEQQVNIPEDSLIGLENDVLSDALSNPQNTPVLTEQLHFRHIPAHVSDAEMSLQKAQALFQGMSQMPSVDVGIILKTIEDILIGVDNKLAHTVAHINMAKKSRDPKKKQMMDIFLQKISQLNAAHDKFDKILSQMQEKRLRESQQQDGTDPKLKHEEAMYALRESHAKNMMDMESQTHATKADQLRNQSAMNTRQKMGLEQELAQHKAALASLSSQVDISTKVRKAMADAQIQQTKARSSKPAKK